MIFQFLGDDDVFVYIDGVLVLDIGGTHGANSGSINFATGDVTHPREGVSGAAEADDYVTTTLAKKFQTAGMTGSFDGSTFGDYTNTRCSSSIWSGAATCPTAICGSTCPRCPTSP